MVRNLSRRERKERAARLVALAIPAMGLGWAEAARKIGVSRRSLCVWRQTDDPDRPRPAGKNLLRVERFLSLALRTLKRRGVVKESLEELVEAPHAVG